jgi:hypothetical protein
MSWEQHLDWMLRPPGLPDPRADEARDELRLFPIVDAGAGSRVASLLGRDRVEEAGKLVPERAWVASPPLYG